MAYSATSVLARLEQLGSPDNVQGMRRYGVGGRKSFGVRVPDMRVLAGEIGIDDRLAAELWASGWREARLVAAMISDPQNLTVRRMDAWASEFDSWDVCDGVCNVLFRRSVHAWTRAIAWSSSDAVFERRAGFVLMAQLAVHDKRANDERFLALLPHIERGASDERHMVGKGVSWALRQIGKRDEALRIAALECARRIGHLDAGRSRWIASDVRRELLSEAVIRRLARRP